MNQIKCSIAFLIFILITSCSSIKEIDIKKVEILSDQNVDYILPKLNSNTVRKKEDIIAFNVKGRILKAIENINIFKLEVNNFNKIIDSGQLFIGKYILNNNVIYELENNNHIGLIHYGSGFFCSYKIAGSKIIVGKSYDNLKLIEEIYPTLNTKFKQQELIYNGKIGNILKFTFNEYLGQNKKPSFQEEIIFDISKHNVLTVKGLKVKIYNVNKSQIEYKLIKRFKN